MGTKIRSDISKRKEYWIPKHRYLELVHFCLQYPEWKEQLRDLDGYLKTSGSVVSIPEENGHISKPVEQVVYEKLLLAERIKMIESAAKEAGEDVFGCLLRGVTENIGYEALNVPCCRDVYYRMYRRFFYILDKVRK